MRLKHLRPRTYSIDPPDGSSLVIEGGAVFEVDDELGASLLQQPDNYAPADKVDTTVMTVDDVTGWVGGAPERAREALDAERARPTKDRRKTLIDQLTALAEED